MGITYIRDTDRNKIQAIKAVVVEMEADEVEDRAVAAKAGSDLERHVPGKKAKDGKVGRGK